MFVRRFEKIVVLLCILSILSPWLTNAQCRNELYNVTYVQEGSRSFSEMVTLPSNRIILGGSTTSAYNLLKIAQNGDTVFSKFIRPILPNPSGISSGSVLQSANSIINIHYGDIILTDTNANVLASKQLTNGITSADRIGITKAGVLENQDIILLANTGNGYFLLRVSADFNTIIWAKHIITQSTTALTLLIDKDKVLVGGYYRDNSINGLESPYLASFNSTNGNLIRAVSFLQISGYSTRINQIINAEDGYLIEISHVPKSFDPTNIKLIIRLDSSFAIKSSKRITTTYLDRNQELGLSYRLLADKDGAYFVMAGSNANLLPVVLARVSADDQVLWTSNTAANSTGFGDLKATSEGLIASSVSVYNNVSLNRTETSLLFVKSSFTGITTSCFSTITTRVNLTDTVYAQNNLPTNQTIKDSSLVFVNINTQYVYQPITTFIRKCNTTTECNFVQITGPNNICNSSTNMYTARRNNGCYTRVDWEMEPRSGFISRVLTDSTITLSFRESGQYRLIAKLNTSCGILADTLIINASVNNLNLGSDTVLCPGQNIRLQAGKSFASYTWQNGTTDSILIVNQPGKYWVSVLDFCNRVTSDTITISAGPTYSFSSKPPIEVCNGDTVTLTAATGFQSYRWQPNYLINTTTERAVKVFPQKDTTYIVTVRDSNGCSGNDSFNVKIKPYPSFRLPADTLLCDNAILNLTVNQFVPGTTYRWQDGSSLTDYVVNKPGMYEVTINMNGCIASQKTQISYDQTPKINLGKDSVKCIEDEILLNVSFPNAAYLWQNGSTNPTFTISRAGTYYCTITTGCGVATDTILVQDEICECMIEAPNTFSPNGDGIHDTFYISTRCDPALFSLNIFNRNGQIVYSTNNHLAFWDGTFQKRPVPIGTYYYVVKIRGKSELQVKQKSGSITIIR